MTELEVAAQHVNESKMSNLETTFAKQQLGTSGTEIKILGMALEQKSRHIKCGGG